MDILEEVKSLLGIIGEGDLDFNKDNYWIWSNQFLISLIDVDVLYSGIKPFAKLSTTLDPLTEEEYLFLSISEGQVYVSHDRFLETLRSLINEKG